MARGWIRLAGVGLAIMLFCANQPAEAFIEYKLPLADLITDAHSNYIFLARIKSVDPARPSAVLEVEKDLKGKIGPRRIPINLTGDQKVKHTPELLKRIAPDLPLVCFDTVQRNRHMLLAYTNGTWFQVLGTPDGDAVRWQFTHCEIYLRRTYKGPTADLQQIVVDALAGKKAPPDYDAKEMPGMGPEIAMKMMGALPGSVPDTNKGAAGCRPFVDMPQAERLMGRQPVRSGLAPDAWHGLPARQSLDVGGRSAQAGNPWHPPSRVGNSWHPPPLQAGRGSLLFGVIALPFFLPIAALLQLLFPGLLRDQWRNYQVAISVLLSQSTVIFLGMLLRWWLGPVWWLSDRHLWFATVSVALIGLVIALVRRLRTTTPVGRPVKVEYLALGSLVVAGAGWAGWQFYSGTGRLFLDEMGVVFFAALLGVLHLLYRQIGPGTRTFLTTELVFLAGLGLIGSAMGVYLFQGEAPNVETHAVIGNWAMARGNEQRTGSLKPDDPGPQSPRVLWTYDPAEARGRMMFHSSPTVVDGLLYIGALHQVSALQDGYLYCIDASTGKEQGATPLPTRSRLWRFTANDTLRPVFATPIVASGKVYIGEGYHQDSDCRLFCLDARDGNRLLWAKPTRSHVESSPCIEHNRVYFGAGDDGIYCVDPAKLVEGPGGTHQPEVIWQVPGLHVDVSPLVVGDKLFAGSTVGDKHQEFYAVAVDVNTGKIAWQQRNELRVTGSPSYQDGRVFFGLGNGKLGQDADTPQGAVWCLTANDGQEVWTCRTGNGVMATPALMNNRVFAPSIDGYCYCIDQKTGDLIWKQKLAGPVAASPITAGGKVYLLTTTGVLSCLDAATGHQLWDMKRSFTGDVDDAYASPVLVDGRLYVAVGGKVYCIGDK